MKHDLVIVAQPPGASRNSGVLPASKKMTLIFEFMKEV